MAAINQAEPRYAQLIQEAAQILKNHPGPIYIASHLDADGDAIGSVLGLYRGLQQLGRESYWMAKVPRYLEFLLENDPPSPFVDQLPPNALLVVLDTETGRMEGAPLQQGVFVLNIDHHGTNPRNTDFYLVDPTFAATAQMIKDLLDALGVSWSRLLATPVLTGMLTDTGNFRFSNTTPQLLRTAADLMQYVPYAEITDRLQWRPPSYFETLGRVLGTVQFHFEGRLVMAHLPPGDYQDDSDDFVGVIRYAEGAQLSVFLRSKGPDTKVSIRSRGTVSAQKVAIRLGGGGHVPAAGATLRGVSLPEAYDKVLEAVSAELA